MVSLPRQVIADPRIAPADEMLHVAALASGVAALDAALPGGGLPLGRLTEVQGPMMGGKLSLVQEFMLQALARGRAAFIDLPGTFFPHNLPTERLLVARPADWKKALSAADVLVGSGEWALVAVDLTGHAHGVTAEICTRLARSARGRQTAVVLLHDHAVRTLGSLVTLRLKVNRKLTLHGRTLEVLVAKNKLAAPGKIVSLPLRTEEEA